MVNKRVVVAMSGGVDSSVAAALLAEQGYEVIGVTMQIWPEASEEIEQREGGCCSVTAASDARRVCDRLEIPFYVLNFRDVFGREVIDRFCREYARGRTPNPCIACNRYVKFEALLRRARELGAAYLATGHYGRVKWASHREADPEDGGRHLLFRAADSSKDQSYALYSLTQEQLGRLILPLGELTKPRVRELAASMGLPTAHKAESQEICFVVADDYRVFLRERAPGAVTPGPIVDTSGRRLGAHHGLADFTVGQRGGLGLAVGHPLYVVRLEPQTNTLVVGRDDEVFANKLEADDSNWIAFPALEGPIRAEAKIRYGAVPQPALIEPLDGGRIRVTFDIPQRAITPGQAVVFYHGDLVLGGATINRTLTAE